MPFADGFTVVGISEYGWDGKSGILVVVCKLLEGFIARSVYSGLDLQKERAK